MLNTRLNAQVPTVQLNATPEIWAIAEQVPVSPRKSAESAKALNEKVGPNIKSFVSSCKFESNLPWIPL